MTTTTTEKKTTTRTITLSDRPPVKIVKEDWDLLASAEWFSGQHACQANEEAEILVRQHADGRTLVYGSRDRGPGGMHIGYRGRRAGWLLAAPTTTADIVRHIRRVEGVIGDELGLGDECIADLPAEEI